MSTGERHPDLVELLTGQLGNAAAVAVGSHLASCESCREQLGQLAVGHALLSRSARTLGAAPSEGDLPPLSLPRPRRTALLVAAAAAVVGLVVGGAATAAFTDRSTSPSPSSASPRPSAFAVEPLTPVQGASTAARGEVEMYGAEAGHTRMKVLASDLPPPGAGRFYYAWLLDPSTQKMLPLGQVGPEGASFDIDNTALSSYSSVDISLEEDDGDPAHSATSVLRGTY